MGLPRSFLEQSPPSLGAITGETDISALSLPWSRRYSEIDLVLGMSRASI